MKAERNDYRKTRDDDDDDDERRPRTTTAGGSRGTLWDHWGLAAGVCVARGGPRGITWDYGWTLGAWPPGCVWPGGCDDLS